MYRQGSATSRGPPQKIFETYSSLTIWGVPGTKTIQALTTNKSDKRCKTQVCINLVSEQWVIVKWVVKMLRNNVEKHILPHKFINRPNNNSVKLLKFSYTFFKCFRVRNYLGGITFHCLFFIVNSCENTVFVTKEVLNC